MHFDPETIRAAATREDDAPAASRDAALSLIERAGVLTGRAIAPGVRRLAHRRHSRMFHPVGTVFRARVVPIGTGKYARVARALGGEALLRFSGALWKRRDVWPDVLGLAIRFAPDLQRAERPSFGDQDLLTATVRSPAIIGLSPFGTRSTDYLANTYFGAAPFELDGVPGRFKLRVSVDAAPRRPRGDDRDERLLAAVRTGEVRLLLEAKRHFAPKAWTPLVALLPVEPITVDQRHLRFNPFLDGRGLRPRGFVHAIRRAAYPASRIGSGAARAN